MTFRTEASCPSNVWGHQVGSINTESKTQSHDFNSTIKNISDIKSTSSKINVSYGKRRGLINLIHSCRSGECSHDFFGCNTLWSRETCHNINRLLLHCIPTMWLLHNCSITNFLLLHQRLSLWQVLLQNTQHIHYVSSDSSSCGISVSPWGSWSLAGPKAWWCRLRRMWPAPGRRERRTRPRRRGGAREKPPAGPGSPPPAVTTAWRSGPGNPWPAACHWATLRHCLYPVEMTRRDNEGKRKLSKRWWEIN